jgi:hypothetical protein
MGCAEATRRARSRVVDWLPHLAPKQEGAPVPANREELAAMIRELLHEELDARETTAAPGRSSTSRKRS